MDKDVINQTLKEIDNLPDTPAKRAGIDLLNGVLLLKDSNQDALDLLERAWTNISLLL